MKRTWLFNITITLTILISCGNSDKTQPLAIKNEPETQAAKNYRKFCASCHYDDLSWFAKRVWKHGKSEAEIINSIHSGFPDYGMPPYESTFTDPEIKELSRYILASLESNKTAQAANNADVVKTEKFNIRLEPVIKNLDVPWGLAFLPDGDMLVTERAGQMIRFKNGQKVAEIIGLPKIEAKGQGGLLDIVLHPDYKNNGWIYFAYNSPADNINEGWNTALMRAKLQDNTLIDQKILFKAVPDSKSGVHFGCKITFDNKGHVFFGVGERGKKENAQDLSNDCGKIHRINEDGTIPTDNPFYNQSGARQTIWSYGQRNPQGLVYNNKTGILWESEHGPMGGDELNIIVPGKNYGWPVITYGKNYDGTTITLERSRPGMEQPVKYWDPSFAPCGMTFVEGTSYPGWEGNILIGSLRFKYLVRCELSGNTVTHEEIVLRDIGRLRNVVMGPDGFIYVAVESPGIIYRLVPVP